MNASENLMGFEFTIDANAVFMYSDGADGDGDEARFLGVAPSHANATEIEIQFVSIFFSSVLAVQCLQHHFQADGWWMDDDDDGEVRALAYSIRKFIITF